VKGALCVEYNRKTSPRARSGNARPTSRWAAA
jgi:hypothetical protein